MDALKQGSKGGSSEQDRARVKRDMARARKKDGVGAVRCSRRRTEAKSSECVVSRPTREHFPQISPPRAHSLSRSRMLSSRLQKGSILYFSADTFTAAPRSSSMVPVKMDSLGRCCRRLPACLWNDPVGFVLTDRLGVECKENISPRSCDTQLQTVLHVFLARTA